MCSFITSAIVLIVISVSALSFSDAEITMKEYCPCVPLNICPNTENISLQDQIYFRTILQCENPELMRCCHSNIPDNYYPLDENELQGREDSPWIATTLPAVDARRQLAGETTTETYDSMGATEATTTEGIGATADDFYFERTTTGSPADTTTDASESQKSYGQRYPKMENNVALIYPSDLSAGAAKERPFLTPRKSDYQSDPNVMVIYPQARDIPESEERATTENLATEMTTLPPTTAAPADRRKRKRKLLRRRKLLRITPAASSSPVPSSSTSAPLTSTTADPEDSVDDLQTNDSEIINVVIPLRPINTTAATTTTTVPPLNDEIMEIMKKRLIVLLKNRKSPIPQPKEEISALKNKAIVHAGTASQPRKISHNFDTSSRVNFLRQGARKQLKESEISEDEVVVSTIAPDVVPTTENQLELSATELPDTPYEIFAKINSLLVAGDDNVVAENKLKQLERPYRGKMRYEKSEDNEQMRLLVDDYRNFKKRNRALKKPKKSAATENFKKLSFRPSQVQDMNEELYPRTNHNSVNRDFKNVLSKAPETFVYNFKPPRLIERGFVPMVF